MVSDAASCTVLAGLLTLDAAGTCCLVHLSAKQGFNVVLVLQHVQFNIPILKLCA